MSKAFEIWKRNHRNGLWFSSEEIVAKAAWDYQQAIIDRLMLEHCPEEMTEEQKEEWAKSQKVSDFQNLEKILSVKPDVTGRLENWYPDTQLFPGEMVLRGNIYDDAKGRFLNGTAIRTSPFEPRLCEEGDIVKTMFSSYLLGKPAQ